MGSSGLNNAMVLHIHKARLDKLSMVHVANDFVLKNDHRKTLFGKFDDVDLRRKSTPVKCAGIQVNINNSIFACNEKYILSSILSICCPEFTANFYLRLIPFLAVQEVKLYKKPQLRWTHFARLLSLRSPYHIQKQCGVHVSTLRLVKIRTMK